MMPPIPINLAVEDALSEAVLRRVIAHVQRGYAIGSVYSRGGFGYLKKICAGLNNAAKGTPFLLLTDLDEGNCPPELISNWLTVPKHPNFILRVAVREVEAWLMADAPALAGYLSVKRALIPEDVDNLTDPKATLLEIVRKSPKRELRGDILPRSGTTSKIGPNYNGRLIRFVATKWNPGLGATRSPSLARAIRALGGFTPTWARR